MCHLDRHNCRRSHPGRRPRRGRNRAESQYGHNHARQQCRLGLDRAVPLRRHRHDGTDDRPQYHRPDKARLRGHVGVWSRGSGTLINIASVVAIAPELVNGVYGGTKAFVLALSRSLHHELADKGIRVQAVLPGATATEFWLHAGTALEQLPQAIIMSPDDVVDAALAGLDQGELFTLPSLPDLDDWRSFENARNALLPNLSLTLPAQRYRQTI